MDVDHFSKYFNNCNTVYLEGRTYPIKVMHAKEPQGDYLQAVLSTLFSIHQTAPPKYFHKPSIIFYIENHRSTIFVFLLQPRHSDFSNGPRGN